MRKNILTILVFTSMVNYITAQTWSPLGTGIGPASYHSVQSFATYNSELYAGGYFTTAGSIAANNIAKWNGTNWANAGNIEAYQVRALNTYNGELYAGGLFVLNNYETSIARWNGTNWANVGNIEAYDVRAFVTYNGELYAAGWFNINAYETSIAKWNGNDWTSAGPEDSLYSIYIECMTVYNNELYAAGAYYQIGGGGIAEFYRVIKWNGSAWSTVVTIPAGYTLDGALGDIYSMSVYNGELYISGSFTSIDTLPTHHIAKWNGTNWSAVGTGINPAAYPICCFGDGSEYSYVKSLAVFDGALYAGGRFDSSGTLATRNIAKWDGTNWSSPGQGVGGPVYALIASDSSLYAGGQFNSIDGNSIPANKVGKWRNACAAYLPQPGTINGNNTVCANSTQVYSIDPVPNATHYTWNLPAGWIGSSVTNSISVIPGTSNGTISVFANNNCGNSTTQSKTVNVMAVPGQPGIINGITNVCPGTTQTYTIGSVTGATSYTWSLPNGWTGNSNSPAITTVTAIGSGAISVTANNSCGSGLTQTLPVAVNAVPDQPGLINGNDTICEGSHQTYFIDTVPGATGYEWTVPSDWAFDPSANSISVIGLYSSGLSVIAYNDCGSSIPQVLPISVLPLPQKPEFIDGNDLVCKGTTHLYVINPVQDATNYTWALPPGWAGNSITDSMIATTGGNNGIISVSANNSCGSSALETLHVSVDSILAKPGNITGNLYAYTDHWNYYSIDPVNGASGYQWIAIDGIIQSTQNTHVASVNWKKAGTYELSVQVVNGCGMSTAQKITVKVSDLNADDPFDLTILPNPSHGEFFLKAKRIQDKMIRVEVLNMAGQLVFRTEKNQGTNYYSQLIDLDKMAQGVYAVKIMIDDKVYVRSVVIKH